MNSNTAKILFSFLFLTFIGLLFVSNGSADYCQNGDVVEDVTYCSNYYSYCSNYNCGSYSCDSYSCDSYSCNSYSSGCSWYKTKCTSYSCDNKKCTSWSSSTSCSIYKSNSNPEFCQACGKTGPYCEYYYTSTSCSNYKCTSYSCSSSYQKCKANYYTCNSYSCDSYSCDSYSCSSTYCANYAQSCGSYSTKTNTIKSCSHACSGASCVSAPQFQSVTPNSQGVDPGPVLDANIQHANNRDLDVRFYNTDTGSQIGNTQTVSGNSGDTSTASVVWSNANQAGQVYTFRVEVDDGLATVDKTENFRVVRKPGQPYDPWPPKDSEGISPE